MDNTLKKEFSNKDVTRMRNLITGKTGDSTQIQTGWEKDKQTHKEGDTWEDDGKRWTIKNGLKQTVTKYDSVKKIVIMPLSCPNCGGVMKLTQLNKKMWGIHQTCFDCVIEKEAIIKREGKWDEYSSQIMNANKNESLLDLERALEEWVDQKDTFVTEGGDVEAWNGGDKKSAYKLIKQQIAELKKVDIYNK